jgi:hypothetical protein
MTKLDLKEIFNEYLSRNYTENEWLIHGYKEKDVFKTEVLNCYEYKNLINKVKLNDKKIGVILSGHIRHLNIMDTLNDLIKFYDIDVFIHTWDNIGIKGNETNINDSIDFNNVKDRISNLFNVKSYLIECNKIFIESIEQETNDKTYFNYSSPEVFIKSQLYSIKKSYELLEQYSKENNVKYDCVIKLRFDLDFVEFNLDKHIINELNQNKLIFVTNSDQHYHPDYGTSCWACDNMYYKYGLKKCHSFEHTNVICDLFAYGSQDSMKDYCSTYDYYDSINESFIEDNIKFIKENNLHINKVNNVYQFHPKGHDGHIESIYYINSSYPERILQKKLNNYMLVESKKIKIRFNR